MKRFIEGQERRQVTLMPECLEDFIGEDNAVRVFDAFFEELDLRSLGFDGVEPAGTGRPSYHPAVLLKLYIYGYRNRIQSSRRLEHEYQRNVELMWLTSRPAPDFETIADFRRDNGAGIRPARRTSCPRSRVPRRPWRPLQDKYRTGPRTTLGAAIRGRPLCSSRNSRESVQRTLHTARNVWSERA